MPSYKVLEPCFHNGTTYGPNERRTVIVTEEPLKPVPPHLELIDESPAAVKKREKDIADKLQAAKDQQEKDVKDIDFTNGVNGAEVETL